MQAVCDYPSREVIPEEFVAIRKEDWPSINQAIDERVAPLKPRGWRKALHLLREWGVLGTTATVIVALLAIAASAIYQAVARVGKQATFEANTTRDLAEIRRDIQGIQGALAKQSVIYHASLPLAEFKAALPSLSSSVATVRQQNLKVSPQVVNNIQQKLIAAGTSAPGFWPLTSELISYRSLNEETQKLLTMNLPNCTDSNPEPMKTLAVPNEHTVVTSRGRYENCRFTLDSEQDNQRLNSILQNQTPVITFKHCLIVYRGGPVNLILAWKNRPSTLTSQGENGENKVVVDNISLSGPALAFDDCLFAFSVQREPPARGKEITEMLLAQTGTALQLPNP